jgi:low affinity Fe/Cu permease
MNDWILTLIVLVIFIVFSNILTRDYSDIREKIEESMYGKMKEHADICFDCGERAIPNKLHICKFYLSQTKGDKE